MRCGRGWELHEKNKQRNYLCLAESLGHPSLPPLLFPSSSISLCVEVHWWDSRLTKVICYQAWFSLSCSHEVRHHNIQRHASMGFKKKSWVMMVSKERRKSWSLTVFWPRQKNGSAPLIPPWELCGPCDPFWFAVAFGPFDHILWLNFVYLSLVGPICFLCFILFYIVI